AERVVDLVSASVVQVLALQVDAGAGGGAEPFRAIQRRRPADVVAEQPAELGPEVGILARFLVGGRQLIERGEQRLRDVAAAEPAEPATRPAGGGARCLARAH